MRVYWVDAYKIRPDLSTTGETGSLLNSLEQFEACLGELVPGSEPPDNSGGDEPLPVAEGNGSE